MCSVLGSVDNGRKIISWNASRNRRQVLCSRRCHRRSHCTVDLWIGLFEHTSQLCLIDKVMRYWPLRKRPVDFCILLRCRLLHRFSSEKRDERLVPAQTALDECEGDFLRTGHMSPQLHSQTKHSPSRTRPRL